jgi:hypothetical protein
MPLIPPSFGAMAFSQDDWPPQRRQAFQFNVLAVDRMSVVLLVEKSITWDSI